MRMKYLLKHRRKKTAHCSAHLARIFDALNASAWFVDMRATCKLLSSQKTQTGQSLTEDYVFQLMYTQILGFVRISFSPLVHPSASCSLTRKLTLYSQYNTMPKKDKTVGLITTNSSMNMDVFYSDYEPKCNYKCLLALICVKC